nr:MerR family transcriptional regulator [Micromonospora inositola]
MAAAAGFNPQTLRYYERRGLLAVPSRSPGGHRVYPPETVALLRVVKAAQRLGFTLDEVAGLLEVGGGVGRPTCGPGRRRSWPRWTRGSPICGWLPGRCGRPSRTVARIWWSARARRAARSRSMCRGSGASGVGEACRPGVGPALGRVTA